MKYLKVKNWDQHMHYKGNDSPRWIKLSRDLLADYKFNQLSEVEKGQLLRLWLFAAFEHGRIPDDPRYVARQIGASKVNLDKFVQGGWFSREGLEEVYSPSIESLALTEQLQKDSTKAEQQPANGAVDNSDRSRAISELLLNLKDKDANTATVIQAIVLQHGLGVGDIKFAEECASASSARSPTKVAVAMLKKRAGEKAA